MENKKNIAKNYIYNLTYQILTIILPIITTPYLSRVLGAEAIGIYGYTVSIVTYFTLIGAIGTAKYGQREIAYVQNNVSKRSKIFWELNIIKICTITIASIIFYIAFCIKGEYAIYCRILLVELLAVLLDITWFFQGLEDFKKVVTRNIIVKLVSVTLIFILIKKPEDLTKYFWIYVLSNFLGNGTLWIKIKKYVNRVKINLGDLKKHIKPMISLFIPQIATSIYTILDKTMLGILESNIAEVGYYEQSQKIIKIALTLVTTMSVVMIPRISNVYAKGEEKKIQQYMKKSFRFDWFLSMPIIFGIMAIAKNFVPWFYGNGYEKIVSLLIYVSPIVIFIALSTTIGSQYLVSIKKHKIQTIAVVIGAISNIILNLTLIPKYKSQGAVIATVIAEFVIVMTEIIYVNFKKYIKLKDIFEGSHKYIFSGVVMCIVTYLNSKIMPIGMMYTIIQIIVGAVLYISILLIIKDDFLISIVKSLFNRKKE